MTINDIQRKVSNAITLIVTTLYLLFSILFGISYAPTGDKAYFYWLVNCFLFTILIYLILKLSYSTKSENNDYEIGLELFQNPSANGLHQIYSFSATNYEIYLEMFQQIVKNEKLQFYAKLDENGNTIVIAKNKYNEDVLSVDVGKCFETCEKDDDE